MAGQGALEHARVVSQVLARCGARADCRLWSNNTGVARSLSHGGAIHFGLVGSADILGIASDGKLLCLEVKTGAALLSRAQRHFRDMVHRFGGRYRVVRSAQEAHDYLESLCLPSLPPVAPTPAA